MSNEYKHGDKVPSVVLCKRLRELADFVTKGPDAVRREFTMRVPAELDHDADLVLSQAAIRIADLERRNGELEKALTDLCHGCEQSFDWQYDAEFTKEFNAAFAVLAQHPQGESNGQK